MSFRNNVREDQSSLQFENCWRISLLLCRDSNCTWVKLFNDNSYALAVFHDITKKSCKVHCAVSKTKVLLQGQFSMRWQTKLSFQKFSFIEKSCQFLLRADLTGHSQFSQSAHFCQKGWDGCALLKVSKSQKQIMTMLILPKKRTKRTQDTQDTILSAFR